VGVNNKQRRAAKQRKRARARAGSGPQSGTGHPFGPFVAEQGWDATAAYGFVELQVTSTVRRISRRALDDAELRAWAESLVRRVQPSPRILIEEVLGDLLARLTDGVVDGGWPPADLVELVRRVADPRHLPTLAALLHEHSRRHKRYGEEWHAAVEAVGPEVRLELGSTDGLASGLRVAALLATAPLMDADAVKARGGRSTGPATEHPKLARVRALLAKAESTDYDEEAEALSAKAQELISRYALDRLLAQSHDQGRGDDLGARRIWLNAPYVGAKAALVDEVASANRCQAAAAESMGFCLMVGASDDLDAVELLVTSLLVQANTAMLRHGRRFDGGGTSRTRSFRKSFLMAYAVRIGERLRAASEATAAEDSGRLLPVLRDHEARVSDAFSEMVPNTVQKVTNITNGEGWAAGVAAADLALLDVNGKLPQRAG
jgi:hypothetical protein